MPLLYALYTVVESRVHRNNAQHNNTTPSSTTKNKKQQLGAVVFLVFWGGGWKKQNGNPNLLHLLKMQLCSNYIVYMSEIKAQKDKELAPQASRRKGSRLTLGNNQLTCALV